MEITFKWTKESNRLIIEEYRSRATKFRDPKYKNKDLWTQISIVFGEMGYTVSAEILDRKFRNLKKTYTEIKDKHGRTGEGRINWEHYDVFDDIFSEDRAINSDITMSSMDTIEFIEVAAEDSVGSSGMPSRKKSLKDYREQQLEIERAKLTKMDRLIDNIEKNTKVHEERNNLLKQIIQLNNP